MSEFDAGSVVAVNIEDEIRGSYMAYAMSVIVGRALPDVRDGLKPVHRRILYAMHEAGNVWNRPYKKSARVVGDVIGKYHPHGDSAVYDALVRLAQPFNMRVPLVDGQGNFGSIDGDPPAAMRYTEVRMTRACGELLADIDRETVDFGPNYDDSELEPLVLPTRIPNLLVNGSSGIAVGMATNIPPHNLSEVLDAVIALMEDPSLELEALMRFIPGPDFPTYGTIYGRQGIIDAYRTGRGVVRIRARTSIEDNVNGRTAIIITELPYQVNKARLIEKIAQLVREKRIEGIHDLRDESDRQGMRVVIELKKEAPAEILLNTLYKMTAMQTSFGINMLAIVAGQPQVLSLKDVLGHFIEFRRDVTVRRTIYLLRKARERAHILEGLQIALDNLDAVIALIRASATVQEARSGLMERFGLSEVQSQAILDMRLQKLTGLERDKIAQELAEVRTEIAWYEKILADRVVLDGVIIDELKQVRELYGEQRRTEITEAEGDIALEDLIPDDDMVVTISHQGYIKRIALSEYRAQKRGGRGKMGMSTKDDDFVEDLFVATAHQRIFVFTTTGRVFQLKVYQLPLTSRTGKGRPIITLLPRLDDGEGIASVLPIPEAAAGYYVVTATRLGRVKKTEIEAFDNINVAGLRAVNINDGDELIAVRLVREGQNILLATREGMAIQFSEADARAMGRAAAGVTGIRLREGDAVIGMEIIRADATDTTILTVTENGYGKRSPIDEYRLQNRGGIGLITIKVNDRNGNVVAIRQVQDDDHLLVVTDAGTIIRTRVAEVREQGRNTMGVTIIRTADGERVVAIARVVESDDEAELSDVPAHHAEPAHGAAAAGASESSDEDQGGTDEEEPRDA